MVVAVFAVLGQTLGCGGGLADSMLGMGDEAAIVLAAETTNAVDKSNEDEDTDDGECKRD